MRSKIKTLLQIGGERVHSGPSNRTDVISPPPLPPHKMQLQIVVQMSELVWPALKLATLSVLMMMNFFDDEY